MIGRADAQDLTDFYWQGRNKQILVYQFWEM
jgi:hypothetical protein